MNFIKSLLLFIFLQPYAKAHPLLKSYVEKPDPNTSWGEFASISSQKDYKLLIKDFYSLKWQGKVWHHYLIIRIPHRIETDQVFYLISNGRNDKENPDAMDPFPKQISMLNNQISVEIKMIPNQPITIAGDPTPRFEDDLIAFAWNRFLANQDPMLLPRFPMVKAAKIGLDYALEVIEKETSRKPSSVIASGLSKRGWTSWLLPLADERIDAIVPIVIDLLNVQKQMQNHYDTYGFWSVAIRDYTTHRITDRFQSKEFSQMMTYIDPHQFLQQLDLPKFIINATNDQFFLPTSSHLYFGELKGVSLLKYTPNSGHFIDREKKIDVQSVAAFNQHIAQAKIKELPKVSVHIKNREMHLQYTLKPKKVYLWQAKNPVKNDFRMLSMDFPLFIKKDVTEEALEKKSILLEKQTKGWKARLIEFEFATPYSPHPLRITSQVFLDGSTKSED